MRVLFLFLAGLLTTASTQTLFAAPHEPNRTAPTHRLRLDVLEAVIRHRLERQPLARGAKCYVYVNRGFGTGLDSRLPGHRIIIGSGKITPDVRKERWYWLDVREITESDAIVVIEDAMSFKVAKLRKIKGRWVFVSEKPYFLT
jgi:hypothetical protein